MTTEFRVQVLAVMILAGLAGYYLVKMESADTIILALKYGVMFLASTLHFLALVYGGRRS